MPTPTDPSSTALQDEELETTDPKIELDTHLFIGSPGASASQIPGLIIMVTVGMAKALLETTFPNKGWEGMAKVCEKIAAPKGFIVLLVPKATYTLIRQEGETVFVGFDMHIPVQGTSNGFSIERSQIRAVHAYREGVSWYSRN